MPGNGSFLADFGKSPTYNTVTLNEISKLLVNGLSYVPGAFMVRKNAFLELGGFDEQLRGFEDEDLILRALMNGNLMISLEAPVLSWRQNLKSASYKLSFVKSRSHYFTKLVRTKSKIRISSLSLSQIRLRFELLTAWDLLAHNATRDCFKIEAQKYSSSGVRALGFISPLGLLAAVGASLRNLLTRVIFSDALSRILVSLGIVRPESLIRLGHTSNNSELS
jgi:hypothetical protein